MLYFWRWLNHEDQPYSYATIDVSNNGTSWTRIWENPYWDYGYMYTDYWTLCQYDISAVADQQSTVFIRWGHELGYWPWAFSGWNIDDIGITGEVIIPSPTPTPTPTPTPLAVKWEQLPNMIDGFHYCGDYLIRSSKSVASMDPLLIADDWICTDPAPITAVTWWGSYMDYEQLTDQPIPLPDVPPLPFTIRIYEFAPQESDGEPGILLAQYFVESYDVEWYGAVPIWDRPEWYEHEFMYRAVLDPPFVQEPGSSYFISIFGELYDVERQSILGDAYQTYTWGWMNSEEHWNSPALEFLYSEYWSPLEWPPGHRLQGLPMDMAFQLWGPATPPTIIDDPSDATICDGDEAAFAITVEGSEPLEYQWYKGDDPLSDGGNIAGALTNALNISPTFQDDAGQYSCTVSNMAGSDESISATLTVDVAAEIFVGSVQLDRVICVDSPTSFSVVATGTEPLYYEWFKDDVTLIEGEEEDIRVGENIFGADTPVLIIDPARLEDTGMYYCVVSNYCGEDVSTSASLSVMQLPVILVHPFDEAVTEGNPVTLSVLAEGAGPLDYQWYKGEMPLADTSRIGGAQTGTLDISSAELLDEGVYSCSVSNLCGMDMSTTASLTVDKFIIFIDFAEDDWTSGGAIGRFTLPGFTRQPDSLTIQAVDASTYGYWESPRNMIPYIHDSIYRVVYTVRGSCEQEDAPTLRMRINTQSSTIIGALVVDSWLDASESPSDEPTSYTLYFDPRDQSGYQDNELTDDLNLGFEMLSFDEDDDTSCIFFLDDVVIDRFNVDAISGEVVYTYDTTEDFENWEFHGFPDVYTLPLNDRAAGSLVLAADNNSTDTYGFWESSRTANEVEIEPDVLYRAVFTVSSGSAQAEGPQVRLRIGTESNKTSSVYVAYSNLDGLNSPKNLIEEEYQVFLYPPQSDVGAPADVNGLVFGMDMLNFTPEDDPNGNLILNRVEVQIIDPSILP